jgi:hypothetical protein
MNRKDCLLLDEAKMAGQSTSGSSNGKTSFAPGMTNAFGFVINSPQPFTMTNLTTEESFTRIVLDGGEMSDVGKMVSVTEKCLFRFPDTLSQTAFKDKTAGGKELL